MVDWSAAVRPSPKAGTAGGIWMAVAEPGQPDRVTPVATRLEARWVVLAELTRMVEAGMRVLCGFDFAFGYPAGTAAAWDAPSPEVSWRWTWDLLHGLVRDNEDNNNNRFQVAAALNSRVHADSGPFWGLPARRTLAGLEPTRPDFPVSLGGNRSLPQWRHSESVLRNTGSHPKSVWQLAGAGAVGSQTITGIPHLTAMRDHPTLADHCRVWPFETGFDLSMQGPQVVLAEVYPSLVPDRGFLHDVRDARQVLSLAAAYRAMDQRGRLRQAFAPPAVDPWIIRQAIVEEGWILPATIA